MYISPRGSSSFRRRGQVKVCLALFYDRQRVSKKFGRQGWSVGAGKKSLMQVGI